MLRSIAHIAPLTLIAGLLVAAPGCREENTEPLTAAEARLALEEASISTQASDLTSGSIELATDFTIGGALEDAAAEIRTFIQTQLPCAEVVLEGNMLSVTYGALAGNCTYRGHTYSGLHTVSVTKNDMGEVVVSHAWDKLENGVVSVTGDATVTWNFDDETRHVVHELEWTRLSDGRSGVGSGDRLQQALGGDISVGIQVDGDRSWSGEKGSWELAIDGVQMRWADPVPQDGAYTLTTPDKKKVVMSFDRVDDDTIAVTLANGKREFTFNVSKLGGITE